MSERKILTLMSCPMSQHRLILLVTASISRYGLPNHGIRKAANSRYALRETGMTSAAYVVLKV